uniref:BPTI/Kunitz inhibitor domain-containing protein n=1 Tax=Anas zonorhyncha TaxID=75864 RepID=A0A8B9V8B8_9AVES
MKFWPLLAPSPIPIPVPAPSPQLPTPRWQPPAHGPQHQEGAAWGGGAGMRHEEGSRARPGGGLAQAGFPALPGGPGHGSGRGAADTCHLPAAPGPCGGRKLHFFYNITSGRCGTFPYGGCGGNPNNFRTRAECHRACLGHGEGLGGPGMHGAWWGWGLQDGTGGDGGVWLENPGAQQGSGLCPASTQGCRSLTPALLRQRNPNPGSARRGCRGCQGHARRSAEVTATAPAHRSAATAAVGSSACPQPRPGRPASARPAQGCSPATTAGSGASETPTAPARRSAACVAVTPCACTRPEVGAARHPAGPPSRPPGPPSRTAPCLAEKPGICPLTEVAPWTRAPCQASCAEDGQCPGDEKCCSSRRCGRVCLAPERDKPGQCPKVRPRQAPELCTEEDACGHDRDCPRQEKCCFDGCAMRCTRPAREHPGECPQAEPCGDPRRRHGSQCLDDSACRRDEKCCSSGCAWVCVAVAVPGESQDGAPGQCVQECDTDLQCPQGQRCTSTSCGRVCGDVPGDAA